MLRSIRRVRAKAVALLIAALLLIGGAVPASAAGGGTDVFCSGLDCITVQVSGEDAAIPGDRGGVVTFVCAAEAPAAIGITITSCVASGANGHNVQALPNGLPGPGTATAAVATVAQDSSYRVCAQVTALFVGGPKSLPEPYCGTIWL